MDIRNYFGKQGVKPSQTPEPQPNEEHEAMAIVLDSPECVIHSGEDSNPSFIDAQVYPSTSSDRCEEDDQVQPCSSNIEEQDETQSVPAKKKKYFCEYTQRVTKSYPVLKKSTRGKYYAYCTVCNTDFDLKHGGLNDCKRHIEGPRHQKISEAREKSKKMDSFLNTSRDENAVTREEMLFTGFLIEHNIPIAASDHVGKLLRAMMPNSSEVAVQKYGCGRTKSSAIINHALAPHCTQPVIEALKNLSFTLALDGGNDSEEKLFPILVSYFDTDKVKPKLLDLIVCNNATSVNIFKAVDEVFEKHQIPWKNCIGVCLDNASVNMGRYRSVKTFIQGKNPSVFTEGCPCHLVHLAARKGNNALSFDADAFLFKLTSYFRFSAKRVQTLNEMSEFVEVEYSKILKHGVTRWLSMHPCIERVLKMYPALKSFFQSEDTEKNARSRALCDMFEDATTELYILFLHSVLPSFNQTNIVLQYRSPFVHKLHECLMELYRILLFKLVKPDIIKAAGTLEAILAIDFCDPEKQMGDRELFIGFTTRNYIRTCSSLEPRAVTKFFKEVRDFYSATLTYMKKKFPLSDEVVKAMKVFDYRKRMEAQFEDIEVLVQRFPQVVDETMMQKLHEEFSEYRVCDLPESSLRKCTEEGVERVDCIWHELSMVTHPATGNPKFYLLSALAKSLLVFPHSNAEIERVFSMVRIVKTEARGNLATEGTLKSLLQCKINLFADINCHQFQPSTELLSKAKAAGYQLKKSREQTTSVVMCVFA